MTQDEYLEALKSGASIEFEELISIIDKQYHYTSAAFTNGDMENSKDENQNSAKLFCFAAMYQLTELETLNCFGQYYQEVLNTPDGDSHPNIRNFITYGWSGLKFNSPVLSKI